MWVLKASGSWAGDEDKMMCLWHLTRCLLPGKAACDWHSPGLCQQLWDVQPQASASAAAGSSCVPDAWPWDCPGWQHCWNAIVEPGPRLAWLEAAHGCSLLQAPALTLRAQPIIPQLPKQPVAIATGASCRRRIEPGWAVTGTDGKLKPGL